jgi:hypothetical protein
MTESFMASAEGPSLHYEPIAPKEVPVFEASFALELVGVRTGIAQLPGEWNPQPAGNKENDRLLTSLFSSLRQGESLTFVYDGGYQQPFGWQIVGKAASPSSAAEAEARLFNVRHAVITALESRKSSYCFEEATGKGSANKAKPKAMKWRGHITPASTVVRQAPASIGFQSPGAPPERPAPESRLPHYLADRTHGFQSIASLLTASPIPIRISLTVEPCRLDRRQLTVLQEAISIIRNADATDQLPTHLEESAQVWMKAQAGYRIKCETYSAQPVQESFLLMLGGEIYHGPVTVSCEKTPSPSRALRASVQTLRIGSEQNATEMVLDLHNCIPASVSLPAFLPRPESLVEAGVKSFYNRLPLTLPTTGLCLGHIQEGNLDQLIYLCLAERDRHLALFGASGTGKSTLEFNLIMHDILHGEGVILLDPHGDLFRDVLASIPAHRAKDVILLDPTNRDRAAGINLLELCGLNRDLQTNFIINEFLKIVEKMYDLRVAGGPMFEQFFRSAMQLIMVSKKATLSDLSVVFENPKVRAALISESGNGYLADFWKMAEATRGEICLSNIGPYITSKINLFAHSALIRPIVGQEKSSINFKDIMDNRKILLVNLSKGVLGELDSQLMGMVILTRLMAAAMERVGTPTHLRTPVRVYVDEFQNFTTDTAGTLLSEARKFGISLTVANQNLNQLTNSNGKFNLIDSVLGNVGSLILFRLGAPDAEKLASYLKPNFTSADLQSLPNFHAAARLLTPNGPTNPFVFQTYPARGRRATKRTLARIKKAQLQYTTPISEVEKSLQDRRKYYEQMGNEHAAKVAEKTKADKEKADKEKAGKDKAGNAKLDADKFVKDLLGE